MQEQAAGLRYLSQPYGFSWDSLRAEGTGLRPSSERCRPSFVLRYPYIWADIAHGTPMLHVQCWTISSASWPFCRAFAYRAECGEPVLAFSHRGRLACRQASRDGCRTRFWAMMRCEDRCRRVVLHGFIIVARQWKAFPMGKMVDVSVSGDFKGIIPTNGLVGLSSPSLFVASKTSSTT